MDFNSIKEILHYNQEVLKPMGNSFVGIKVIKSFTSKTIEVSSYAICDDIILQVTYTNGNFIIKRYREGQKVPYWRRRMKQQQALNSKYYELAKLTIDAYKKFC